MAVERFTPQVVADLFGALSHKEQWAFLEQLDLTAEAIFLLLNRLDPRERLRFSDRVFAEMASRFFPLFIRQAVDMVKRHPLASLDQLCALAEEALKKSYDENQAALAELTRAELKEERDPKPRHTERDDEIVRLRDREGKTFGAIPRLLMQKNPKWCGEGGKLLKRDAVEKAYRRRKGLGTN
jgi:hypothetical protein